MRRAAIPRSRGIGLLEAVARRAPAVVALVAVVCTAAVQLSSTTDIRATCVVSPCCDRSHQVHCPNGATYVDEYAEEIDAEAERTHASVKGTRVTVVFDPRSA